MAVQITDVYKFNEKWAINVDFKKEEYRVCWIGSWRDVPDLTTFPHIHGTTTTSTTRIPHSTAVRELWAKSSTVCYGGDSHIRLLDPRLQDAFSICKVAVHVRQRQSIQDEFDLLRSLSDKNAPVVSVHPDPLVDEDGIFGFKMEQLFKVEQKKLRTRLGDIHDTMTEIHDSGIVHNDFHPGNIMQRSNGDLIVIDFGRSGPVGHEIPPEKQSPLWKEPKFSFEADNIMFKRFFSWYETD